MADAFENDYVVGKGKLYFNQFAPGTKTGTGELYFGNTPEFSMAQNAETLDHYDSDNGVKVKDASVTLSQDNTGTLSCDNISDDNLALWFLGEKDTVVVGAVTGQSEGHPVLKGGYVQLGASDETPQGVADVDNLVITGAGAHAYGLLHFAAIAVADDTLTIDGHVITWKASGATGAQVNIGADAAGSAQNLKTYITANTVTLGITATGAGVDLTLRANAAGTGGNITITKSGTVPTITAMSGGGTGPIDAAGNWEVDLSTGRVYILPDALDIDDGDTPTFTFDVAAQSLDQVISQGKSIYGALRFIATNPVGSKRDFFYPYVKLTPNGDYALKGDTWQTMQFSVEILKLNANTQRVYITKRAA